VRAVGRRGVDLPFLVEGPDEEDRVVGFLEGDADFVAVAFTQVEQRIVARR